jgi:hypothetical protein
MPAADFNLFQVFLCTASKSTLARIKCSNKFIINEGIFYAFYIFRFQCERFIRSRGLPNIMAENLESKLGLENDFKSAGERRIAELLNKYGIDFKYEPPIAVQDRQNKLRIWYPDFFLPEYGIYLEFNGFEGNPNYDNGIMLKNSAYKKNGIDIIGITPSMQNGQLENYIINQIYRIQKRRLANVNSKIYALRTGMGSKYR